MVRTAVAAACAAALLTAPLARAQSKADDHLLAGAQFFRADRYDEALVEFRVAERLGSAGAAWYVASALVKLRRPEEAIGSFARAESIAASERDALLDYYHALACHDARLYGCADALLAGLGAAAGPRIAALAAKIRGDLGPLLAKIPSTDTLDWYDTRGKAAEQAGQLALAAAYFEEAVRLAALRPDGYRRAESSAALRRLRPTAKTKATAATSTPPEKKR